MASQDDLETQVNKIIEPYATQLGRLLHDWNSLHLALTYLYLAICGAIDDPEDHSRTMMLAIWNAVPNDRMQRNMLREVAKERFSRHKRTMDKIGIQIDPIVENEGKTLDEILWILESSDTLGRKRDDSAHAPVILRQDETLRLVPEESLDNPLARRFADKNLIEEFELQRTRIRVLSKHTFALYFHINGAGGHQALPQRPKWPTSPHPSERKAGRARSRGRQRARQHQSSRG